MGIFRTAVRALAAGCVALLLGSCGGKTPPIHYYMINLPAPPAGDTPGSYPITLLVGRFAAPMILREAPIVYRVGENEVGAYPYHQWVSPPPMLVQSQLMELLRHSGRYHAVGEVGSAARGDYVVTGRIDDFEEIDTGSGIVGRVNLDLELLDRRSGRVLWSQHFARDEPAAANDMASVVAALNRGLRLDLDQAAAELDHYFAENLKK